MPTGMLNPVYDVESERLKEQLAYANTLRKHGLEGNTGSGYQGGRVFIVGNPLSNIVSGIGGEYLARKAREGQQAISDAQQQQRADFLGRMPGATETVPQFGPTPEGESLPDISRPKSARQFGQEMQQWGAEAMNIPGMENLGGYALQQAMNAPIRQAEQEYRALEASKLAQERAAEAAKLQRERLDAQAQRDRERAQDRADNIRLAASLRASGGNKPDLRIVDTVDANGNPVKQVIDLSQMKPGDTLGKYVAPDKASGKPPTEAEAKATQYGTRMADAHNTLNDMEGQNVSQGWVSSVRGTERIPGLGLAVNALAPESAQKVTTAQRQFINGSLRRDSGAAISDSEWADANRRFFPQPGESPAIREQKRLAREREIAGMEFSAGKGAKMINEARRGIEPEAPPREGRTIIREVKLKDGRTGVEYSDGSRGYK